MQSTVRYRLHGTIQKKISTYRNYGIAFWKRKGLIFQYLLGVLLHLEVIPGG
jgi:hypothetical protein